VRRSDEEEAEEIGGRGARKPDGEEIGDQEARTKRRSKRSEIGKRELDEEEVEEESWSNAE